MRNAGASGTRFDRNLARYLPIVLLAVLAGSVVVGLRARKKPSGPAGSDSTAASAATPAALLPSETAKGKISRIEIENAAIRTENGAGIGDSEEAVSKIYGQGVIVEPHHYMDGHYLEVQSKSSPSRGVVFETDGRKVTTYRVGFWEPVRWVEGCA